MKKNNNRTEELLHEYSFDELSNVDKDYIMSEMSSLEYNHLHKIVKVAKINLDNTEVKLPPNIKSAIKKELENKWHQSFSWTSIMKPMLWICLGALLMFIVWKPNNDHAILKPTAIPQIPLVDTVYIELRDTIIMVIESPPIVKIKEVIKYREVIVEANPTAVLSDFTSNQTGQASDSPNGQTTTISLNETASFKTGASISTEEELMDLLTPIPTDGLD